jgi:hypothetical protein
MAAMTQTISQEVQGWLDAHGIKPNPDGTVRLIKLSARSGRSHYVQTRSWGGNTRRTDVLYEPGERVEANDYDSTPSCGYGLHFAATVADARRFRASSDGGERSFVCDVDLESLVVIDKDKVKARFAFVLYEGDETDCRPVMDNPKAQQED